MTPAPSEGELDFRDQAEAVAEEIAHCVQGDMSIADPIELALREAAAAGIEWAVKEVSKTYTSTTDTIQAKSLDDVVDQLQGLVAQLQEKR